MSTTNDNDNDYDNDCDNDNNRPDPSHAIAQSRSHHGSTSTRWTRSSHRCLSYPLITHPRITHIEITPNHTFSPITTTPPPPPLLLDLTTPYIPSPRDLPYQCSINSEQHRSDQKSFGNERIHLYIVTIRYSKSTNRILIIP